ncbi:MAG: metal-dependent hydrolase [Armatimonadetes bacterium]|nr:metal-dependent hydrolase [Armatimonadota bacterium]
MLIDTNAYLGHWATRQLRYATPDGLLALMDRAGIDLACVSSAAAVLYKDCHRGNEELAEAVAGHRDRLIPFAVLNPAYAGWRRDLAWCRDVLGARGLRLYPAYHAYGLTDPRCTELVAAAAEANLLVSIPVRQVDHRQRHWLVDASDVPLSDIAALVAAHPDARFIVLEGAGYLGSDLVRRAGELPANYWLEISRPDAVYTDEIGGLLRTLGAERLVFGSGIPFKYPEPATLRLEVMRASEAEKDLIRSGNIGAMLGL